MSSEAPGACQVWHSRTCVTCLMLQSLRGPCGPCTPPGHLQFLRSGMPVRSVSLPTFCPFPQARPSTVFQETLPHPTYVWFGMLSDMSPLWPFTGHGWVAGAASGPPAALGLHTGQAPEPWSPPWVWATDPNLSPAPGLRVYLWASLLSFQVTAPRSSLLCLGRACPGALTLPGQEGSSWAVARSVWPPGRDLPGGMRALGTRLPGLALGERCVAAPCPQGEA